jgi:hypothetical protein
MLTKECAEEGSEHRVWEGREEGAELADHAQAQHEGGTVLDHPAAANLWTHQKQTPAHLLSSSPASQGPGGLSPWVESRFLI